LIKDAIFVGNDLECGKANLLNCLLACQIKTIFWIQTTFNGYEISPVINNISFSNCLELCYNGEMCTHLTYKNEKCSMKNAPTLETIRKSSVFNGPSVSVSLPWKFKSLGKDP
uniref:Apple domain-containing protein n=1 Tax=Romanomermis culicivorax TaxID=13658 RepID=A0A915L1B9_ROMCU